MDVENINKETFDKYCPAARTSKDTIFKMIQPYFQQCYEYLKFLLFGSKEEFVELEVLQDDETEYVCCTAFARAIPSLDIVLTGTGFGVVSTQDTAPASQQRVKAVRDEMEWQAMLTISRMLGNLIKIDGWGTSKAGEYAIRSIYYDPQKMLEIGPVDEKYALIENWKRICHYRLTAEQMVKRTISPEYYEALMKRIRTASMTNADIGVYENCLNYMARAIKDLEDGKLPLSPDKWEIRDYMERYADMLPEYKKSRLYNSLHGEKYENKQEDPTFFFIN